MNKNKNENKNKNTSKKFKNINYDYEFPIVRGATIDLLCLSILFCQYRQMICIGKTKRSIDHTGKKIACPGAIFGVVRNSCR